MGQFGILCIITMPLFVLNHYYSALPVKEVDGITVKDKLVGRQEDGEFRVFTGDMDVFDIIDPETGMSVDPGNYKENGDKLLGSEPGSKEYKVLERMRNVKIEALDVMHGPHMSVTWGDESPEKEGKESVIEKHRKGELLQFDPDG